MKYILFVFYCFVFPFSFLIGQQDIKLAGIVVEQNSQFNTGAVNYLSNAQIKSAGAAPQLSDGNGHFTLVFADRPFGNVARIFASKTGYELVNTEELAKVAVMGRNTHLKVVMCKKGTLLENQLIYYKIVEDVTKNSYQERLALLEKKGREGEIVLAEMQLEFNQEIKTVNQAKELLLKQLHTSQQKAKDLADKFVKVNLDNQSVNYQRAFRAFLKKDIDRALVILDSVDLKARLATNTAEMIKEKELIDSLQTSISFREQQIEQDVNQCVFLARLYTLKYELVKAEAMFELALQYREGDESLIFEFAHFLQKHNRFRKAGVQYEKALAIYRALSKQNPDVYLPYVATTLNNLGVLLRANNELDLAKISYEEALIIYRELSKQNPNVYLPDVAMTLNNLGVLLRANNELDLAQASYEEALVIRRDLSKQNPDIYLPDVATTLNNLGVVLRTNNEMDLAKGSYEEALVIRRDLSKQNPDIYLPDVATTLNNLGNLLRANNEMDLAKGAYKEALVIYRGLSKQNPDVYLSDVAMILNNLGILLSDNNEMALAQTSYEEALVIRRDLSKQNPNVYLPDVATTLNNLGILLRVNNEMDLAKGAYKEALVIYRVLSKQNPNVYLPYVATTLNNLGNLLSDNNELDLAQVTYEEALVIRRDLSKQNPDVYLPDVAMTLNNLGNLFRSNNEIALAKEFYKEALVIYQNLSKQNPDVYLPGVAMTLNNLGVLLRVNNEMTLAQASYEEALVIYQNLSKQNPDVYLPDVAMTLNNLGVLLRINNEMDLAKEFYEEALLIRRDLSKQNPDVYLPDVAMTLNNLGVLLNENNEIALAKEFYEEALVIYRDLSIKNPDVYLPNVASTLNNLGILLNENDELYLARDSYEEALAIRRSLAKKNPKAYNLDLSMTAINLGLLYEQLLESTGEMILKNRGIALMKEAKENLSIFPSEHPTVKKYQSYIERLSDFFSGYTEEDFLLYQKIETITNLKEKNELENDSHQKVARQQEVIQLLHQLTETLSENERLNNLLSNEYGSLAWYCLFDRQFEEAEQAARKGLALDAGEEWINTNLALALLYQGKLEEAKAIYLQLKDQPFAWGREGYRDIFLTDLETLEMEGVSHPDVKKIRQLLKGR